MQTFIILFFLQIPAVAASVGLTHSPDCILQAIAMKKHITLRAEIPSPEIFVQSKTSLQQFQDAVEPQWNIRPDEFTNVYVYRLNEIYLIDEAGYYQTHNRFIDDSLAHEFVHFLQVKYQNADLNSDESLEFEAVDIQTWFRETFMRKGLSPCQE